MGMRREARERAVQFLFQYDVNPTENLDVALEQFWEAQRRAALLETQKDSGKLWEDLSELPPPNTAEASVRLFADPLIRGVIQHRVEIDALISNHAKNWDLHRMAVVDRNVLRLGAFEMLHRDDIPPVVSINEAVDVAKRFSTEDSGRFVNGILDKIRLGLMRPSRIID